MVPGWVAKAGARRECPRSPGTDSRWGGRDWGQGLAGMTRARDRDSEGPGPGHELQGAGAEAQLAHPRRDVRPARAPASTRLPSTRAGKPEGRLGVARQWLAWPGSGCRGAASPRESLLQGGVVGVATPPAGPAPAALHRGRCSLWTRGPGADHSAEAGPARGRGCGARVVSVGCGRMWTLLGRGVGAGHGPGYARSLNECRHGRGPRGSGVPE